jgi:hypothetical protein
VTPGAEYPTGGCGENASSDGFDERVTVRAIQTPTATTMASNAAGTAHHARREVRASG